MIILKKGNFIKKLGAALLITTMALSLNFTIADAQSFSETLSYYSSPQLKNKYQFINGPCWAVANIATLETFLSKKGILKESLSEKHLLSYANQSQNNPGFHYTITHGGNGMIANGYFSAGLGPVFEKECSYDICNSQFDSKLAAVKSKYWIKGIKNIGIDSHSIKKAIATYGAATIIYHVKENLYHAVSAIGWDNSTQSWLIKDSAKYPNNYTSLPYSTQILESYCITDAESFPSNIKIYQHDNFGVTGACKANSKLTVANVFDFSGNETLDQVTICSPSSNSKINVFLAPVSNNGIPTSYRAYWKNLYSGTVPHNGYFTLNLKNKVHLDKNKYAIIVQLEKTNNSCSPGIGYQATCEGLTLPSYHPGKSFILCGQSFSEAKNILNLENMSGFSIKAITKK